ncbi:MAG: hypothetical protein MR510_12965 [Clostridium sp.]|uniref:hypothetical protein n=1 Tax=Clostridium sp. TaxID=1506 RepID=UPI002A80B6BE|nr:hypothetical protein [Clostridium sp.]MCI6693370.1 hypothetical protein [Clostridium sp.]MDY4253507.1 hypothetical protein [Clostridium sp.]MDY6228152.1 hypothetical protein [Clostridium sp.]
MDGIVEQVKNKLNKYDLPLYDELDIKTQQRLCMLEESINILIINLKKSIDDAKLSMPNITNIIKYDKVDISRKTIYNQDILKKYIELTINDLPDYFNEKKMRKLEDELNNLKDMYYKVIDNIIDSYNKDEEIRILKETIDNLKKENDRLTKYIYDSKKVQEKSESKIIPIKR